MKIDPVFPSVPVLNPPRYKFKPRVTSSLKVVDQELGDEVVPEEEEGAWPGDVKLLLLIVSILCLVVLFS